MQLTLMSFDVTSGVTFPAILWSKCTRFNGKWDRVCRNVAKKAYRMLQYNKYHYKVRYSWNTVKMLCRSSECVTSCELAKRQVFSVYGLPRTVEFIYCIQCSSRDVLFSQYRRYSRAVSATACTRSGLSHRLALIHEDGRSV